MSKTVQGRSGAHSKASKRRKKQKNRLIIVVIEILVLLILAAVLFVTVKLSKIQKDTSFNKEDIEVNEGLSSESQEIMAGYTTIALFGLDNRSNGNLSKGNSDVIMIASINNDTHAVKLVSVYRDSYLDIGGGTFKKCNSAYAKGGQITKEDIDILSIRQFDSVIFDLTDNLGRKNVAKSLEVLRNLIYAKEPIQKILITLYNHFKKLYIVKLCEKYKKDIQENLNLKPNQTFLVSKYKKQAGYFKEDELYNILKQFINLDEKYKDGDIDLNIGIEAVICGYCS